jgi:hypothetical protein
VFLSGCNHKEIVKFDKPVSNEKNADLSTANYTSEDFDQLEEVYENLNYDEPISEYTNKLDGNFRTIRFKYFVIFSNLDDKTTYQLIDSDIRNTTEAMINNYIEVRPDYVTAVFLFKDMESYKKFAMKEFEIEEHDLSPYGFYKISRNVILVRYVSWKGSVTHEVTHAMLQNDFPDIPSWFNEGFAALHEKPIFNNGKLIGNFNWRILALRRAFNENKYTSLRYLMNTNDNDIYSEKSSFYYAQACYALMLLQEKNLVEDFYKTFRDNYSKDHTGIKQFEKLTGMPLEEFDKELTDYIQSFKQEFN